jgi:chemotaxis signal transduction protein
LTPIPRAAILTDLASTSGVPRNMSQAPLEEPRVDEPSPEVAMESLLLVRAGGRLFALPLDLVQEVLPLRPITPVPGADSAVAGIANVRGRVIAIVDLAAALRLTATGLGPDHRLIVLDQRGRQVGIGVVDVVRIARLPADAIIQAAADPAKLSWLRGTVSLQPEPIDVVDTDQLLDSVLG